MYQFMANKFAEIFQFKTDHHMIRSTYPKKEMINVTDKTVKFTVGTYDVTDLKKTVGESTLSDTNKKTISEILSDEAYRKEFSPDKFNVHFTNRHCDSILEIDNTSLPKSDVCLAVVIE